MKRHLQSIIFLKIPSTPYAVEYASYVDIDCECFWLVVGWLDDVTGVSPNEELRLFYTYMRVQSHDHPNDQELPVLTPIYTPSSNVEHNIPRIYPKTIQ